MIMKFFNGEPFYYYENNKMTLKNILDLLDLKEKFINEMQKHSIKSAFISYNYKEILLVENIVESLLIDGIYINKKNELLIIKDKLVFSYYSSISKILFNDKISILKYNIKYNYSIIDGRVKFNTKEDYDLFKREVINIKLFLHKIC